MHSVFVCWGSRAPEGMHSISRRLWSVSLEVIAFLSSRVNAFYLQSFALSNQLPFVQCFIRGVFDGQNLMAKIVFRFPQFSNMHGPFGHQAGPFFFMAQT